jgi:hypothetical protein
MAEEIIQQAVDFLSVLLTALIDLFYTLVSALEAFLQPIDPVLFIFGCFIVGVVLGLAFGKKKGFKEFFKMPAAHWRIRRGK